MAERFSVWRFLCGMLSPIVIAETFLLSLSLTKHTNKSGLERKVREPNAAIYRRLPRIVHENHRDFPEEELKIINYTAERVGVEPELLMAIRKAENGKEGMEFGIKHTRDYNEDKGIVENGRLRPYENLYEKQASWCAWTIKKNFQKYLQINPKEDFISFLQKTYCPLDDKDDTKGLNKNWRANVRFLYEKYRKF